MVTLSVVVAALLGIALFCWSRAGSETDFRVITRPTAAETFRNRVINTAAFVGMAGVAVVMAPPLTAVQPDDGFVIDGGVLLFWLPAFFFAMAGAGIVAMAVSIAVLGGVVSRTDEPDDGRRRRRRAPQRQLSAKAAHAAEGWARRNPRGAVLGYVGFLALAAVAMALAGGREVRGSVEHLAVGGYFRLRSEVVPWQQVAGVTIERGVDPKDGKRRATVRFELGDGRAEELGTKALWALPDPVLERIATFCAARGVPVTAK